MASMFSRLALLALILIPLPLRAAVPPEIINAARILEENENAWAYTQTTMHKGKRTVERFDPSRPAGTQWRLLIKDGHVPSAADLRGYKRNQEETESRAKRNPDRFRPEKMIREGTLRLVRDDDEARAWEFKIHSPDQKGKGKSFFDALNVRATILKDGQQPVMLEMSTTKQVSPLFSVNINQFSTKIRFAPVKPGGPALPAEVHAKIRGRAFLVKNLDSDAVITFSDYEFVGRSARAAAK